MRTWLGFSLLALTLCVGQAAWGGCTKSTGDQISKTGKYGKIKFKDPYRNITREVGIPTFKGRIYFRPRNGACFVSVLGRNGDLVNGTGDLKHPGCSSGKWGWWDIKWTDNGKNGQFDATVDFMKTQYKISLMHGDNKQWELCM